MLRAALLSSLLSAVAFAQEGGDPVLSPPPLVEADWVVTPKAPSQDPGAGTGAARPGARKDRRDAQDPGPRRLNRLTAGPVPMIALAFPLEYERAVSDKLSVFIGPRFGVSSTGFGIGGSAGLRAFLGDSLAPSGIWAGPEFYLDYLTGRSATQGLITSTQNFTALALGLVGYTFIAPNGLTTSFGGGGGFGYADWNVRQNGPTNMPTSPLGTYKGLIPALAVHLNVGWAF